MDAGLVLLIWMGWTLIAYAAGWLTHRVMTRQQRHLLKFYRRQAQVLHKWGGPIE